MVSINGPLELVGGELALMIPLNVGGAELAPLARGIGQIEGDCLKVIIRPWLAEKLNIHAGSLVQVDNHDGKFNITRVAPEGEANAPAEEQLECIGSILRSAGFSPSVRGKDSDRLLYVEHMGRAAEVYWDEVAFMIELFEQPGAHSVRDYHQDTPEHAGRQAVDWLLRRADSN